MIDAMKVALITHEGGGIASVSYGLARSLAKKEVDTTIFTEATVSTPRTERRSDYLRIIRLPTIYFPPRSIWFQALSYQKLSRMLREYDVIHGVSPEASFFFTFFKEKLDKPFVGTIHGSSRASQKAFLSQPVSSWTLSDLGYHVIEFPLHEFSIDRILRHSDHTTLCSFSVLEELVAYKGLDRSRVSVIYNGIDFDEIGSMESFPRDACDQLSLIYAGRLVWYKGVMFLLQAFRQVRKNFRRVHLNIFGRGPLEKRIKRFIVKSNLQESVSFFGYAPREKFLAELKKSDIAVFPSLYEAQSVFVLEAMAFKKPVLTFDFPFMSEIIKNGDNGLMAKGGSVQDLTEKIQLLLSDDELRHKLGEKAYESVKRSHNWDVQSHKYLSVYDKVMENHY